MLALSGGRQPSQKELSTHQAINDKDALEHAFHQAANATGRSELAALMERPPAERPKRIYSFNDSLSAAAYAEQGSWGSQAASRQHSLEENELDKALSSGPVFGAPPVQVPNISLHKLFEERMLLLEDSMARHAECQLSRADQLEDNLNANISSFMEQACDRITDIVVERMSAALNLDNLKDELLDALGQSTEGLPAMEQRSQAILECVQETGLATASALADISRLVGAVDSLAQPMHELVNNSSAQQQQLASLERLSDLNSTIEMSLEIFRQELRQFGQTLATSQVSQAAEPWNRQISEDSRSWQVPSGQASFASAPMAQSMVPVAAMDARKQFGVREQRLNASEQDEALHLPHPNQHPTSVWGSASTAPGRRPGTAEKARGTPRMRPAMPMHDDLVDKSGRTAAVSRGVRSPNSVASGESSSGKTASTASSSVNAAPRQGGADWPWQERQKTIQETTDEERHDRRTPALQTHTRPSDLFSK